MKGKIARQGVDELGSPWVLIQKVERNSKNSVAAKRAMSGFHGRRYGEVSIVGTNVKFHLINHIHGDLSV